MVMNYEARNLIERLRDWDNTSNERNRKDMKEAADLLERIYSQPVDLPEGVAWRTFDGEGGYDYRDYDDNENYAAEWARRNPNHSGWVDQLYTAYQLTKAVQEATAWVLEAAADVCESVDNYANPMTAKDCADEIRNLIGRVK